MKVIKIKLITTKHEYLRDTLKVISPILHESRIKFNEDCIEIIAMDAVQIMLTHLKILKSCFNSYSTKNTEIGLNLDELKKAIDVAKEGDTLIMELNEEESVLKVSIKGKITKNFRLRVKDVESKEKKVPNIDWKGIINMPSLTLVDMLSTASFGKDSKEKYSSIIFHLGLDKTFTIRNNSEMLQADSKIIPSNESSMTIKPQKDIDKNGKELGTETLKPIQSKYQLEYLDKVSKASSICKIVNIKFSTDYPIRLDFKVPDRMSLVFFLAPLVENN